MQSDMCDRINLKRDKNKQKTHKITYTANFLPEKKNFYFFYIPSEICQIWKCQSLSRLILIVGRCQNILFFLIVIDIVCTNKNHTFTVFCLPFTNLLSPTLLPLPRTSFKFLWLSFHFSKCNRLRAIT